ncbi:MAG: phosphatase PAP2 family protein [Gemmatimonadales bacterium]
MLITMLRRRQSRLAVLFLLLLVVLSVLVASGFTNHWDVQAMQSFASLRRPRLTRLMQLLTDVGSGGCEIPVALGIAAALWRWKSSVAARRFLLIGVSGEAIYALVKLLMHRPRPTIVTHLSGAGWFSFPSGHATMAWIVWGFGLVLLAELTASRRVRVTLRAAAVVLPVAISISRVYLGVHYPTDVLGGLFLAIGWVLCWWNPDSPASRSFTSSAPATR